VKIPTTHIDLKDIGYEGYWVEMPRSIKEGFLHEFSKLSSKKVDEDSPEALDQSRVTNAKLLELVTAWNIDDDSGKVLPLMSKTKDKATRDRIVSELPVDVIVHLAQRMTGSVQVPEKTQDF
jgi:hypothetical protein